MSMRNVTDPSKNRVILRLRAGAVRSALIACTAWLAMSFGAAGCSQDSVWIALESQQRADAVQQTVFDRQHDALRVLLFRDVSQRLAAAGVESTPEVTAVLNEAWNERDLIEFWQLQYERARALRLVGVDAKLYGSQSVAELLYKSYAAKWDRFEDALAAEIGRRLAAEVVEPPGESDEEAEPETGDEGAADVEPETPPADEDSTGAAEPDAGEGGDAGDPIGKENRYDQGGGAVDANDSGAGHEDPSGDLQDRTDQANDASHGGATIAKRGANHV